MRTDQMESLSLTRRQRRPGVLLAFRGARERGALGDDAEQRQAIDTLQILRLPDPSVQALEQKGDAVSANETEVFLGRVRAGGLGLNGRGRGASCSASWLGCAGPGSDSRNLVSILTTVPLTVRTVSASGEMKPLQEPPRQNRQPPGHYRLLVDVLRSERLVLVWSDSLVDRGLGVCCAVAHSNPSVAWLPTFSKPIKSALSSSKPNVAAVRRRLPCKARSFSRKAVGRNSALHREDCARERGGERGEPKSARCEARGERHLDRELGETQREQVTN